MNGDNNENAAMPKALTEKLRAAASRTSVLVPEAVDETVLSRSRLYFAQIRQRRSKARQPWWLAAAACVALLAFVGLSLFERTRYERADIDHSGRVDILDAFALARRIQQ